MKELPVTLERWRINRISCVGTQAHETLIVDSLDEGGAFEKTVWAALESMFPFKLFRGPTVAIGKKERELVDVLAYHQYGTFLIEAKDVSVFSAGPDRTRERRAAGTIKQAAKGLGQLVGAAKALRRGYRLTGASGNTIEPVLDQPMHCIVLLTELMHEGDWEGVERDLREAIRSTREYFHVLDLAELMYLVKAARGRSTYFDFFLMERCRAFCEGGTVHSRVRVVPGVDS